MNEIVNNFLLAEDKFMPEIHIKHFLVLLIVLMVYLLKTKKELKDFYRQETQIISTRMILIKLEKNGKYMAYG